MKVIIAGSRTITKYGIVSQAIRQSGLSFDITEIVSGGARGVDTLAIRYGIENCIPIKIFPANWKLYGKRAGFIRNVEMTNYADALIAIWDGKSKGTKMTIDIANGKRLKVYICRV